MRLRGNVYLRTLLVQGARSTLQSALRADPTHASRLQRWIRPRLKLVVPCGSNQSSPGAF
nr:hypothetical protein [Paraburkholderia elongata]